MRLHSRILSSAWLVLLGWTTSAPGQPTFDLVLESAACPEQAPGTRCAMARLITRNAPLPRQGAEAWSIGIAAEGCSIAEAITDGTASAVSERIGPEDPNAFLQLEYRADQVVLAVVRDFRTRQTLDPRESPHDLLLLQLDELTASSCDSCVLRYVDGLRGSGRQVDNTITSDLRSVSPSLGRTRIPWREPPCTQPPLDLTTVSPRLDSSLSPCRPNRCFAFAAPPGRPVLFRLTDSNSENANAMYLRWGEPATPERFDHAADRGPQADQELLVTAARGETAFLLVNSFSRAESSQLELIVTSLDLTLESISPTRAARDTRSDLVVLGAGFQDGLTRFRLRSATDETLVRESLQPSLLVFDRTEVGFDLTGLPVGTYHVEAFVPNGPGDDDLLQSRLDGTFEIRERIEDVLTTTLTGGRRNGRDRLSRMTLSYENTGNDAVSAPILRIRGPEGVRLRLEREDEFQGRELLVMGIDPLGFAGRLSPGTRHEIAVLFRTSADFACDVTSFDVAVLSPTATRIPWSALEAPAGVDRWDEVRLRLEQSLGSTWQEYNDSLAEIATRLSRRGFAAESVAGLLRFAVRQALDRPIAGAIGTTLQAGTLSPLRGATVAAFDQNVLVSSTITDTAGDFALDCLQNDVEYRLEVDGHGPGLSFSMPPVGDVFGLRLIVDPQAAPLPAGGSDCDSTGLPTVPIVPPTSLFVREAEWETLVVCAIDPNTKDGPQGERPEGFLRSVNGVSGEGFVSSTRHTYRIFFENTGNAPAQTVEIRDRLIPEIDLESVQVGEVIWGDHHLSLQPTQQLLSGYNLPVSQDPLRGQGELLIPHWQDPERQLLVRVTARVFSDRVLEWRFETLDPESLDARGEPEPVSFFEDGFLPPDDDRGSNEGYVTFSAEVADELKEDQPVSNEATITFDGAEFEALITPTWTNFFSRFRPAEVALAPSPANGAEDVSVSTLMSWSTDPTPPVDAFSYTITVWKGSTDTQPLRLLRGLREAQFQPGASLLPHGETILWQVTTKNRRDEPTTGPVWTFTTGNAVDFVRGDSNIDGLEDISDSVFTLSSLFEGGPVLPCLDSADTNDDGTVDVSDAIRQLGFLFLGSPPPPAPRGACGPDPTPDPVTCGTFECVGGRRVPPESP